METRLFKTKKIAEKYIRENYPDPEYALSNSYITEDSDYDARDMPNLQWSGETPAWTVENKDGETVAVIAWWEEGDDEYKLYVGEKLVGTFDNSYDAREAYDKAVDEEELKDEEEEEVFEVKLFCNGEDITP